MHSDFVHSPSAARRTKTPFLARKGHKSFAFTGVTNKPNKSLCEYPAPQIGLDFLKNMHGEWQFFCLTFGPSDKGLKMILNGSIENRFFGFVARVTLVCFFCGSKHPLVTANLVIAHLGAARFLLGIKIGFRDWNLDLLVLEIPLLKFFKCHLSWNLPPTAETFVRLKSQSLTVRLIVKFITPTFSIT